jgi:methyltransferase family protein
MPELNSPLHLDMLEDARRAGQIERDGIYGLHWGDPQTAPRLREIRDRFLLPYVHPDMRAIEIGPGGGRWTRYLLGFGEIFAVDYHQRLLDELAANFRAPHLRLLKNNGADFPGIEPASVDFVFSFGCFVHLDMPIIKDYLRSIGAVLKPTGSAVLQYSDKRKVPAQIPGFSDNDPERMRAAVKEAGFAILEEELELLPNASVVRFRLP